MNDCICGSWPQDGYYVKHCPVHQEMVLTALKKKRRILRDHALLCVHGKDEAHAIKGQYQGHGEWDYLGWCVGGASIEINYEAAAQLAEQFGDGLPENAKLWHDLAADIIDVALGIVDEAV